MARSKLTTPCESNSIRVHEDAPQSNFRKRIMESRKRRIESYGSAQVSGAQHDDIRDNMFHGLMTSNRGVL